MSSFEVEVSVVSGAVSATVTPSVVVEGVSDWDDITGKPSTFSPSAHTHDDRYYTEDEIDDLVENLEGGQGVTDHGALTGRDDDDHTQYHNDTRGDARYSLLAHNHDSTYVNESDHTKAAHDALNIDAETLDGIDSTGFATSGHNHDATYVNESDHTKAAHDALDIDADTLDGHDTAYFATATSLTDHTGDSSGAHPASAISVADAGGDYTATDVEGVLAEIAPQLGGGASYRTLVELGSDVTNSTTTLSNITGLSFAVTSGVIYRFHAHIIVNTQATTTGVQIAATGPASPTMYGYNQRTMTGGSTQTVITTNILDSGSVTSGLARTTVNIVVVEGVIQPSSSGTFQMRFSSEAPGTNDTVTIKAGSTLEYW